MFIWVPEVLSPMSVHLRACVYPELTQHPAAGEQVEEYCLSDRRKEFPLTPVGLGRKEGSLWISQPTSFNAHNTLPGEHVHLASIYSLFPCSAPTSGYGSRDGGGSSPVPFGTDWFSVSLSPMSFWKLLILFAPIAPTAVGSCGVKYLFCLLPTSFITCPRLAMERFADEQFSVHFTHHLYYFCKS